MQVNCKSEIEDQSIIDLLPVGPHMTMLVLQLWAELLLLSVSSTGRCNAILNQGGDLYSPIFG